MFQQEKRMNRKIALITGGNTGIGKETAIGIAKQGVSVVIVSRDFLKGKEAVEHIRRASGNKRVGFIAADLSSQKQIHTLAEEFRKRYSRLDILINNAGVIMRNRVVTEDGLEYQLAVNHLAPFLITNLLIDLLIDNAPSRIINVSSQTHFNASLNLNDINFSGEYNPNAVYTSTKLMNVLFTIKLAQKLKGTGVTVNCLHPGAVKTKLLSEYYGKFGLKHIVSKLIHDSPQKGARTSIYLALSPEVENVTGKYFSDLQVREPSPLAMDIKLAGRLWDLSSDLCGVHKPA
jgi:retinol dehydrogenase 12